MGVVVPFEDKHADPRGRIEAPRRARGGGHGAGQRDDPVAHRLRRDDDPGGGQPPHFLRRQAAAADADAGDGRPLRLPRRRPCQARRQRRVHAHGDAAPRRRGRRERHAPRQARGAHACGATRPASSSAIFCSARLSDDGRGRLDAGARHPVDRRGGDRRGRGDAARGGQEHRNDRGRVPRGHPGKTAELFAAACEVGPVLAGAPRPSRPPAAATA